MQVDLTVKRLFVNDNTSEITIASPVLEGKYPEGKITIPIIGSILESPEYFTQEDLDRYNLFIFDITFDNELNISLTINGWEIVNVIPEI